ncbi:MAG: HAMP domain-containing histidine kinase [Rhizobium sp.]|nr:HAMP domain-containing histidine kinase [Rhizobium sp.]
MKAGVLRALRKIGGERLFPWGNDGLADPRRAGRLELRDSGLGATAGILAAGLAAALGADWSAILPSAFAGVSACLLGVIAWRDARPRFRRVAPVIQAEPAPFLPIDHLPGLVVRNDGAGRVLSATGADRAMLVGRPEALIDVVHLSTRIDYLQALDSLRQGANAATAEFLLGDEASFRPVRGHFSAQRDRDGSLAGFVVQMLDMSAEVALRGDLAAARTEARSANEAKTRFLAAVSHELRTPLNAILGFSDILLGEYFGRFENDRQKEYVQLVNQSGHHLLAVVNTMLDMSKIEAGRYELVKEPFAIDTVLHAVDEMLALEASRKGVVFSTRVSRGLEEVVADRRAVKQILINLANNAIKFTKEGGVVTIDAAIRAGRLELRVSDTGIGIPVDKLALIGMPFMQVQNDYTRRYEGTGLGLALVKGLVALHGGDFVIESTEGAGTVITVSLPVNGDGGADADVLEFPPRLETTRTGEMRDGYAAQAKIA